MKLCEIFDVMVFQHISTRFHHNNDEKVQLFSGYVFKDDILRNELGIISFVEELISNRKK